MDQKSAPITVLIADANAEDLARTHAMVLEDPRIRVLGMASEAIESLLLLETRPDVLLLSTNIRPNETATTVKQLLEVAPRTQILLLVERSERVDVKRVVLAGARGILQKPVGAEELIQSIHEMYDSEAGRRQRAEELDKSRQLKAKRGRVIVVFSPKGGVGCTLLACNLAIALQQQTGKRVALADYSVQFGTVGTTLNLQSLHSLSELLPHADALDSTILDDVMVRHPSGLRVLLAPSDLEEVQSITSESLVGVLDALRSNFDYVVVDIWHALEDAILEVMEFADSLLLVTTPEVPALGTARRFFDALKGRPQLRSKLQLVVNRLPSNGGVSLPQIERSMGLRAAATIPSDGRVITASINEGVPAVQRSASSGVAQSIGTLAKSLVATFDPPNAGSEKSGLRLGVLGRRRV